MGKSGSRKKKSGVNQNKQSSDSDNNNINSSIKGLNVANGGNLDSPILLQKAHELKEEGNKRFQAKDYVGALEQYENGLKLILKGHPDRAVFHNNKSACLMQMKPISYETVISECSLALQVQPRFVRALLRRARAFEAIGKYDMSLQDVHVLLSAEPNNKDALDIVGRLRVVLGPRQEAQLDLQSRPSPAALGASAALGTPITGLGGPCLPARPVSKKQAVPAMSSSNSKVDKPIPVPNDKIPESKPHLSNVVLKPSNNLKSKDKLKEPYVLLKNFTAVTQPVEAPIQWRPLKLAYDNDIRLSKMPVKCSFRVLRDIVSKRFPMSKFLLIKYKDADCDLITITCTPELRLAESSVDKLGPDEEVRDSLRMLKLYVVEVSPEHEPPIPEEEEEEDEKLQEMEEKSNDMEDTEGNAGLLHSSQVNSVLGTAEAEVNKIEKVTEEKPGESEDPENKEVEMDDWLFEFAQLFRTHVGIDPDAHIDLHELGMELCSTALEETITSEGAQVLFDKASLKFQEVAALAFFNWGNVHMCAARKRIPIDDSASKELMSVQLQTAYDWVKEKYSLAKKKYEEALEIKADFYEGLLALGQQQFEMAKLHWSFVVAKKDDLSAWDPTETLQLFDSAEEKMKAATVMWEKLEEQRANELKDPTSSKKDNELLRRRKKASDSVSELSSAGAQGETSAEAAVMRSQIHLFWGNMLFERSQVECKLGMAGWKENLDTAMERFKLAGASETDIATVLKNHCSNEKAAEVSETLLSDFAVII